MKYVAKFVREFEVEITADYVQAAEQQAKQVVSTIPASKPLSIEPVAVKSKAKRKRA